MRCTLTYLVDYSKDDEKKSHFVIAEEQIAEIRRNKSTRAEHATNGSSKLHLVAVSSQGEWMTKLLLKSTDDNVMNLRIEGEEVDTSETMIEVESNEWNDIEADLTTEQETIVDVSNLQDIKFDVIKEGTFVALTKSNIRIRTILSCGSYR